jgi:hypothetical protein
MGNSKSNHKKDIEHYTDQFVDYTQNMFRLR